MGSYTNGNGKPRRVCVFCGSNPGARPEYETAAQEMGRALVDRGLGLVYGGGRAGLMGTVADAVLDAGGEVIGVIPEALMGKEVGHRELTELHVVDTMHTRKAMMADMASAFVAMPGGFGTFEEICEVITWSQLGFHPKPCGLLNIRGFYDPMLALFDHAVAEGFVKQAHREMVLVENDPNRLLCRFERFVPATVGKWIGRAEH